LYALLGLALGYAVAKGVLYFVNKPATSAVSVVDNTSKNNSTSTTTSSTDVITGAKSFATEINAQFEGDNKANVVFNYDDNLTVTQGAGAKAKYYYVTDANKANVAVVYTSVEGGRGYTANDYIDEVIRKAVPSATPAADVTYGAKTWTRSESSGSEWNVLSAKNGEWLVLVENKKANHDKVVKILETLTLE
jgi:hypothetical protein